jgi:2,5-diketo-D-gluconate reductase A
MNTRTLRAGVEIPYLGFGTYLIPDHDVAAAVSEAIRAGYRHIDTAEAYKNEPGVGAGIRQSLASEGLSRSDLFVTTKLWPGNPAWGQTAKTTATTMTSLDKSLERLQLDYVDLYLIHAPFEREQRLAQWNGLVELQRQGRRNPSSFATSTNMRSRRLPTAAWYRSLPGGPSMRTGARRQPK